MKRIAVVEDESDLRELLKLHLERDGYESKLFATGDEFLADLDNLIFDMALLDIMLPGTDGLKICQTLRQNERFKEVPIIILTAKGTEVDIVVGLELGADDYITKPFSPRELMARIKAIFRRMEHKQSEKVIRLGDIEVFPEKIIVKLKGEQIDLTTTEFKILEALVRRKGRVLTRSQILDLLGDDRQFVLDRTVDVHILNIRRKLGSYGKIIQTIRGIGYKIIEDQLSPENNK
ncbi:MAG: response regulator [Candidatus Zixiibacteriota bacterium]